MELQKDVYRAISEVMQAVASQGIAKTRRNQQQGYDFRGIDDVYDSLAPIIAKAGLCVIPRMTERTSSERETAKGGVLFYVVVRAEFDFVSCRDGSIHTAVTYGEAMDSGDKATNKAMSAAYKYACFQTFCIPIKGDNDADGSSPQPGKRRQSSEKPSAPGLINEDQQKQIFALMHQAGKSKDEVKAILASHGFQSSAEITGQKFAEICNAIRGTNGPSN